MTDTHTHLYMEEFAGEESQIIEKAIHSGIGMMIFPGVSKASTDAMISLYKKYPDNSRFCIGLHPTELNEDWEQELDNLKGYLHTPGLVGIGETGIDLHWDASNINIQKEAFRIQIGWAIDLDLPLIIHCREGINEALDVLCKFQGKLPRMIFHSFTSGIEEVRKIREVCDPYFGINGVVTFKNAQSLREALPEIGIERIVLETDSPYLSPTPFRGQRNDSSRIPMIKAKVAETLDMTAEETEYITDLNAKRIFSI